MHSGDLLKLRTSWRLESTEIFSLKATTLSGKVNLTDKQQLKLYTAWQKNSSKTLTDLLCKGLPSIFSADKQSTSISTYQT